MHAALRIWRGSMRDLLVSISRVVKVTLHMSHFVANCSDAILN